MTSSGDVIVTVNASADDVVITVNGCGTAVSGIVTLVANATDNVGVTGTQFSLDGVNLGPFVTTSPYTFAWDTSLATNGCHAINVVARDAAGNQGSASISATVINP
jgi:hypothetical protein